MLKIQELNTKFISEMVQSAYKFEALTTKEINEPLLCDCELKDFYCSFCGSTEEPIKEPFCYPYCPRCKGV